MWWWWWCLRSGILPPRIYPGLPGSVSNANLSAPLNRPSSSNSFRIVQKQIMKQSTDYPNLQEQSIKHQSPDVKPHKVLCKYVPHEREEREIRRKCLLPWWKRKWRGDLMWMKTESWEMIKDNRPFLSWDIRPIISIHSPPYNPHDNPVEALILPVILNHRPVFYGVNTPDLHRSLVLWVWTTNYLDCDPAGEFLLWSG